MATKITIIPKPANKIFYSRVLTKLKRLISLDPTGTYLQAGENEGEFLLFSKYTKKPVSVSGWLNAHIQDIDVELIKY